MAKTKAVKYQEAKERQEIYNRLSLSEKITLARKNGGNKELKKLLKKQQEKEL